MCLLDSRDPSSLRPSSCPPFPSHFPNEFDTLYHLLLFATSYAVAPTAVHQRHNYPTKEYFLPCCFLFISTNSKRDSGVLLSYPFKVTPPFLERTFASNKRNTPSTTLISSTSLSLFPSFVVRSLQKPKATQRSIPELPFLERIGETLCHSQIE